MRILVTGAAGFIGFHISRALLQKDFLVVGIDNLNHAYPLLHKHERLKLLKNFSNFHFYNTDITRKRIIAKIFNNFSPNTVIHLAARTGVRLSLRYPKLYHRVNVTGTEILYELAAATGVKQFLFSSSSSVYGNATTVPHSELSVLSTAPSPYAKSKQLAEQKLLTYFKRYHVPLVIFRFFSVYGPWGRPDMAPYLFTQAITRNRPVTVYGDGQQARDYTYIDDVTRGLLSAIGKKFNSEIINLGNDQPVTIASLIYTIEKMSGKIARIRRLAPQLEESRRTWANIQKAQKLLGWRPRTRFSEGMQKFFEWYTKNQETPQYFSL